MITYRPVACIFFLLQSQNRLDTGLFPFKLKKLKRLQRAYSRKQKGSKNREKSRRKLAVLHARIASVRKDALHKFTTYVCKNHAHVAIEDLHVAGMLKNH